MERWRPHAEGSCGTKTHAEYTLLEPKNLHCKLDGAKMFATLEPCAPGSREPPKLASAERIVLARIKEVWIGIEDPDPRVDRKGIKYLLESLGWRVTHGVEIAPGEAPAAATP